MRPSVPMTRRQMLRLGAGSLLAAGLWPGALALGAEAPATEFSFLAVNDVHYIDEGCGRWLEGIIKQMKAHPEKPEFCLLIGDLAEHGKAEELEPVGDLFKGLGLPVYVVPGNHDYQGTDNRAAYDRLFPGALNYSFEHRGWQFVGLDSTEGSKHQATVSKATLNWLDASLAKLSKKRPTVLFTHMPLGPWLPHRATNSAVLLERFKEHNLNTVFNGHFHASTRRHVGEVLLTTNRCCSFRRANHDGSKEKGYFLCRVKDGKVERTFVEAKVA